MIGWPSLVLNGLLFLAAWWVAEYGLRQQRGVTRALAAAILAWVWSTLGMQVLGVLGLLRVEWLLAWTVLGLLAGVACRLSFPPGPHVPSRLDEQEKTGWEGVLAVALVVWAALTLGLSSLLMPVKVVSDGPIYHLYFAARWWKAGRLFLVASPFGESAATYFPANGDLWFAWLMVGWGGDRLARIGQAPFLLMATMAAYGCARELGASRTASLIATALFAASPPLILFAFEANVDTIFVAGYLTAAFFFLRFARERDDWISLVLGGLAAGEALGTKSVGTVFIPPLLLVVSGVVAVRARSIGRTAFLTFLILGAVLTTSGFWYARNWLLTGNPLYPLHLRVGNTTLLSGWYGPEAMRDSIYYIPANNWRALVDILVGVLDPKLALFWLAAIAGVWSIGRRSKGSSDGWVWTFSAGVLLNVALYWLCIPYRTQQRFMLQAIGIAVVPLAQLLERRRWLGIIAVVLLALHMLTPQAWPIADRDADIPWDLSPLVPNAFGAIIPLDTRIRRFAASGGAAVDTLAILNVVVLGIIAIIVAKRLLKPRKDARPFSIWTTLAGALVVVSGIGYSEVAMVGADSRRLFFPPFPDFYLGWMQLDARSGPTGSRLAYAGTNIPYYLMGVGLRNEVEYVNIDGRRGWLMHDYHHQSRGEWPNSRPGWDRAQGDYDAWLANLEAARIQLLVVTKVNPGEGAHNVADSEGFPIERQWADGHPEAFEPLYGVGEQDPWFRLYRLRPRTPKAVEAGAKPTTRDGSKTDTTF